jgi:hypothetical protein
MLLPHIKNAAKCTIAILLLTASSKLALQAQTFSSPRGTQVETIIQADAAEVWTILLNLPDYPNWNPYITKIEGNPQKGKRLHIVVKGKEKDYDFKAKILDLQPNQTFAWGGSALFFFKARHYFYLEQIAPDQLKFTQGESWGGLFGKSYGKKVYQEAAENFQKMNTKLQEMVEGQPDPMLPK